MKIKSSVLDYILTNFSQLGLMSKYFILPISSIEYCLEHKSNKVNNPLRRDYSPSLGFMYRNDGRLISKDWSDDSYTGDIFDIVALLLELDSRKSIHFIEVCKAIINDNAITYDVVAVTGKINNKNFTDIKFKSRIFNDVDNKYWKDGGANLNHVHNRHIYAANYIWIKNMNKPYYIHNIINPAYVYYLGGTANQDKIKTYNPKSLDKAFKFRTNHKGVFEAEHELYKADTLIITKSRKDKIVIESLLHYNNEYICDYEDAAFSFLLAHESNNTTNLPKYCITSFNSEAYRINNKLAHYLKANYNNIIVNVDYDKQGIMNAFYHNRLYGFNIVFLGNNKDIYSEFTVKEIQRYFDKILLINPNITLFNGLLKGFIKEYANNYTEKDMFEYCTVNGVNKGETLINKIFKYER